MKRLVRKALNFILISFSLLILLISLVIYLNVNELEKIKIPKFINEKKTSYIYDKDDNLIRTINNDIDYYITYEDLNKNFINALIAIEDASYFNHHGYDLKRIIKSLLINLKKGKITQGASTLTQQLVKNVALNNEKKISRKIRELYLAINLEKDYSKEEILTYYCNEISFEGTKKGVNYASYKLFNKHIKDVNLPESATLVALLKSPTLYNPLKNIDKCNERKNLVLKAMKRENFISNEEYEKAISIDVTDLLNPLKHTLDYNYQAYIDAIYSQLKEYSLDPFTDSLKIYSNLDVTIQKQIDEIQEGKNSNIQIKNPLLNIGACVIDNQSLNPIAVSGGRNYQSEKIYNRAVDLKAQPASLIKPLLSYPLSFEALKYCSHHEEDDSPRTYPNSDMQINNVDHKYLGKINLIEALGYSRNTIPITLLEKIIKLKGQDYVTSYLDKLNLLDVPNEEFTYAYALGGYKYGLSPLNLAAGYAMIANLGVYKKPSFIRKIINLETGKEIKRNQAKIRILGKESAYLTSYLLKEIVNKNYYNIALAKPLNVECGIKTGTSNYDKETKEKYQIPLTASKGIWCGGFTSSYSIVVYCGFDKLIKGEKTYLEKNDKDNKISKLIFKELAKNEKLNIFPSLNSIKKVSIVKGLYPYKYYNDILDPKFKITAYFNENYLPSEYYNPTKLFLDKIDYHNENNEYTFTFPLTYSMDSYLRNIEYNLVINDKLYKSMKPVIKINLEPFKIYKIKGYLSYEDTLFKSNEINLTIFGF